MTFLIKPPHGLCGQIRGHIDCYVDVMSVLRDGGILDMSVISGMAFEKESKSDSRFAGFHFCLQPYVSSVPPSSLAFLLDGVTPSLNPWSQKRGIQRLESG